MYTLHMFAATSGRSSKLLFDKDANNSPHRALFFQFCANALFSSSFQVLTKYVQHYPLDIQSDRNFADISQMMKT